MARTTISSTYRANLQQTYDWFLDSTNYTSSPMVLKVALGNPAKPQGLMAGSHRTIYMVAGIYREHITDIVPGRSITYRVTSSLPPVRQDFTQIRFYELPDGRTRVDWEIEVEVPSPVLPAQLSGVAVGLAGRLYSTIMKAAASSLAS